MKKTIMITLVVMVISAMLVMPASALATSESDRPVGFIGFDIYAKVKQELIESGKEEDGVTCIYTATMLKTDNGYWMITLEGKTDETKDYAAFGLYDHYPTEEDMNVLWANRIHSDELNEIMDELN